MYDKKDQIVPNLPISQSGRDTRPQGVPYNRSSSVTEIVPSTGIFDIGIAEIWRYRELLSCSLNEIFRFSISKLRSVQHGQLSSQFLRSLSSR